MAAGGGGMAGEAAAGAARSDGGAVWPAGVWPGAEVAADGSGWPGRAGWLFCSGCSDIGGAAG